VSIWIHEWPWLARMEQGTLASDDSDDSMNESTSNSLFSLVPNPLCSKTTLIKLMAGVLQPTMGDIRPHGHLKLGRFTQHFVDVLDLEMTPLEFFETSYPEDAREDQRKILGRFGISGARQVQRMAELSDGQKSRVVFAKLGRDCPHILLLDEVSTFVDGGACLVCPEE